MPYCPKCRYEYVPTATRCPDCDEVLVDDLSDVQEFPPADYPYMEDEFVSIFVAPNEIEAEIVKNFLLGANIPVLEKRLTGREPSYWQFMAAHELRQITLTVPESRAEDARKLIETLLASGENG